MRNVLMLVVVLAGCSLIPKQATDKAADVAIGYCTTTGEAERTIIRQEANAKTAARCKEKGMTQCPRLCVSCDGTGSQCQWNEAPSN